MNEVDYALPILLLSLAVRRSIGRPPPPLADARCTFTGIITRLSSMTTTFSLTVVDDVASFAGVHVRSQLE